MEGGDKPTEKMFYEATETAYNPNPPPTLNGWRLILNTPTLDAWFDGNKSILIGVRGTNITDKKDLFADANIPLNRLTATDRYKKDVADLRRVFADYPPERYEYYLAGHSLGGAIINQLKADFPMLKDAVQYNPAFQPVDFFRSQKGDIKRIYTSEDGLYKLGGRFFRNNVVIPSKIKTGKTPIDAVSGHLLSNFAKMYEGAGDLAVAFGGAFLPKAFYSTFLPEDVKALKSDRDKYGWLYTKVKDFAHIFSNGNPEIEQSLAKALGLRVMGDDLWEYMGIRGFDADHERANRYLATATINAILKAHPDAVDRKMAEYVANNPERDLTRAEDRDFVFRESVMKKYTPPAPASAPKKKAGVRGGALEQRPYESDEKFAERQARVQEQEQRLAKLPVVSKDQYFAPNTIAGRQLANSEPAKRIQTAGTYLSTLAWYKDPQVNANWEKAKKKRQADKFITALGKLGSLIIDSPIGDKYDPLGLFKTARGLILGDEEQQARDQMRQDTIDAKIEAFPKDKAYWISKEPAIREFEAKAKRDLEAWKDATYKKYVEEQTARIEKAKGSGMQKKSKSAVGGVKGRKPTFEYSRPDLSESEKAKERAKFYRSKEYKEWKASEEEAPHPKTKAPAEERVAPRGHPAGRPLEEEVQEANVPVLPPKEEEKKRKAFAYSREGLTKEEKAGERAKFYREQKKAKEKAEEEAKAKAREEERPKARRMVIVEEEEEAPVGVVGEAPADWLADLKERGWSVETTTTLRTLRGMTPKQKERAKTYTSRDGITIDKAKAFYQWDRFPDDLTTRRLLVQPNLHEAWLLEDDPTPDKISTFKCKWTKLGVIYDNRGNIDFDYGDEWTEVYPKDKDGNWMKDAHFTLTYNKSDPKKHIVSAIAQTDTDPPSYYTGRQSWRWDWRLRNRRGKVIP